ncbi:MAG: hypothetical protein E6K24_05850 [Gammaproteobacteria bacterium]|nr:MAG: hypothetical protein E6K24_05850 [Gammaproteobacteria bacterium]
MKSGAGNTRALCGAALLLSVLTAPAALAVPSFARQTGMACEACHTVYPELTHFGRVFKANGYVLANLKQVRDVTAKKEQLLELAQTPPLSIMVQASYSQLSTTLPDVSVTAPGVAQNGTAGFPQQLSLFYAGKIAPHFGAFAQLTYANDSGTISIDNTDLRFANMMILPSEQSLVYGVSLNNNPTVQDLWNSTPAFGFPYASSNAVVSPLAGTEIDGALAQDVAGLSGYLFWNESLYAEVGGYRSAKQGAANALTGGPWTAPRQTSSRASRPTGAWPTSTTTSGIALKRASTAQTSSYCPGQAPERRCVGPSTASRTSPKTSSTSSLPTITRSVWRGRVSTRT